MRSLVSALCAFGVAALALAVTETSVNAWECDFLTGGGFIVLDSGAKGTFGVGGGCKHGSGTGIPPAPYWGHLEYHDHGTGLNVHWTSITAYRDWDEDGVDAHGQPVGRRLICGTARTNLYGDVNFAVVAKDAGEPGVNDEFEIALTDAITNSPRYYTGTQKLGGGTGGGGNIQLHKPNNSNDGVFGGSCPPVDGH